jgi:DNA-binding CsgD family transcriptional regulator
VNPAGLSIEDYERILATIDDIARCDSPDALSAAIVGHAPRLIRAQSCAWTEVNLETQHTNGCMIPPVDVAAMAREMSGVVHEHPVIRKLMETRDGSAKAISDFLSRRTFQSSNLYQQFYRKHRTEDQLSIAALFEPNWLVGLVWNRDTWGFTDREKAVANALRATLFQTYWHLRQLDAFAIARNGLRLQQQVRPTLVSALMAKGLSRREAEVAAIVAEGGSNCEIAAALGICEGTVRKHVNRLFLKLGVHNRSAATRAALALLRQ